MGTRRPFGRASNASARAGRYSLLALTILLAGCGSGTGSGNGGNNISVSITNKVTTLQAGTAAISFSATVQNDSSNSGVTWNLTANGIACSPTCGTLSLATSSTVTYTPPASGPSAPNGQPTLTATSVAKTNKSDADTFTITAALKVSITNKFVSVNTGASAFVVNATVQNDATNSGVTWALTGTACATSPCGSLSGATPSSITYTPPASAPAPPNVTLTATSEHDSSKSDSASFAIVTAPISVRIGNKVSTVYAPGSTAFFSANVENDPSGSGVAWTLTLNGANCSPGCGTISAGTFSVDYTPPSTVPASPNAMLTAISKADGTKSDFDTFTISVPPPISVSVSQISSALAGSIRGINFDANVQNDSSGGGVSWTLTCAPSTNCGSLSGNTATTVIYTPPPTAPASPDNQATIRAASVADNTKFASDVLTVTTAVANNCSGAPGGQESLLNGNYALIMEGFWGNANGTPMLIVGSFAANGNGGITGGEEDVNDTISPQNLKFTSNGSLYTVGSDHRGCLQLTNTAGTTTVFRFSVGGINSGVASTGRIIEFDDNSGNGAGNRGSGILRLQDSSAFSLTALKAQYAFGVRGWSGGGSQNLRLASAGSFNNSSGSLNGVLDENIGGILFPEATGVTGNISPISGTTGRAVANFPQGVFDWAIYVVSASEFFIIGTDPINVNPVSLGIAVTTGTSFTASSLSGSYVVRATGSNGGSADVNLDLLTMAPGGAQAGTISGTVYSYGAGNGAQTATLSGVTYNVDAGSGRTVLGNPGDNLPVLYLTTPTDGIAAFVVGVGADAVFGMAEPQTGAALPAGTYIFGTEDPSDNTVPNKAGVETITSGGAFSSTFDQSTTSALPQGGQTVSGTVSLGPAGTGNIGPSTVAITSGSKLFSIDESGGTSGPAAIAVTEQ